MSINITSNNGVAFGAVRNNRKAPIGGENDFLFRQYCQDIEKIKPIRFAEERELAKKLALGGIEADKARQRLIEGNLKYVIAAAKRFAGRGVPLMDLIQEGNMGLQDAAYGKNVYDGSRKFIGFAHFNVLGRLQRAIQNHSTLIRIPANMRGYAERFVKVQEQLEQKLQRPVSGKYVARKAGIPYVHLKDALNAIQPMVSIEERIAKNPEHDEFLRSRFIDPRDVVDKKFANKDLQRLLGSISKPRGLYLTKAMGLFGTPETPIEDIAKERKCSAWFVQSRIRYAIHELRRMTVWWNPVNRLRGYLR